MLICHATKGEAQHVYSLPAGCQAAGLPEALWAAAVPQNYQRRVCQLLDDIQGDHSYMVRAHPHGALLFLRLQNIAAISWPVSAYFLTGSLYAADGEGAGSGSAAAHWILAHQLKGPDLKCGGQI